MDNVTSLPHDSENILRLAQVAIEEQDFEKAITLLQHSLTQKSTMDVSITLILLYIDLHRLEDAKDIWEGHMDYSQLENFPIFLKEWLKHLPNIYAPTELVEELSDLLGYLTPSTEIAQQTQNLLIESLSKSTNLKKIAKGNHASLIQECINKDPIELLTFLKDVYREVTPQTPIFLKKLLLVESLGNYICSDILHFLIRQKDKDAINTSWFGQEITVKLDQLTPYHQSPAYQANLQAIKDYFGSHDPHLLTDAIQQFQFHALIFYPYIDDILLDDDSWLRAFRTLYLMEDVTPVSQDLINYVQQANIELMQLYK